MTPKNEQNAPQIGLDDLTNVSTAEDGVFEVMGRIRKHAESRQQKTPQRSGLELMTELEKAGFPLRHRMHLDDMHGPGLTKAQEHLARVLAGDCILLLVGTRGPGKTQMATWWAAQRWEAGKTVGLYRKCADIISEIKRTWSDGGKKVGTEDDVLRKYRTAKYLVIDELHERGASDWEARTLVNILDHRYDNMLTTVLIANYDPAQAEKEINPSVLSRAQETGGMVECNWKSYRSLNK